MSRDEVARYLADYAAVTGNDSALRQLLLTAGGTVDMREANHRVAVIDWLRAWGCRHLRCADTERTAEALGSWWDAWEATLPGSEATLTTLNEQALLDVEQAYDALAGAPAAGRALRDREVDVVFGDTAAAKVLFVARPQVFPPWDEPIRLAFGWRGGGASYAEFLRQAASTLAGLASRLDSAVDQLPQLLGRQDSSPPKIVDEFLWIRITRGL